MKNLTLLAAIVVSTITPAFAIADADLTTAALAGKTLTFTIVNGTTPFATTGVWTGTFATAGGTGFTVANVTGNTVNIASTQTGNVIQGGINEIALSVFIAGRAPASLALYHDAAGIGKYEVSISGLFGTNVSGTFTIGTALPPAVAEIGVQQPGGKELVDGMGQVSFGKVKIGKSGAAKIFTIRNSGAGKLSGLVLSKAGLHQSNFTLTKLSTSELGPAANTTFRVTFKPTSKGAKTAMIRLVSSDADESTFDIKLVGQGMR